jgi:hypothetical protein
MKEVREAIERWRRTRERRTAMPAELWVGATALARTHGAYRIARALRVDYQSLARRLAEAGGVASPSGAPSGGFVELRGADLMSGFGGGTVVSMSDGDGTRMRIELGAGSTPDMAAALVDAFCRRTA